MALGADKRRADVLDYWRIVEMFSPQKVDPVDSEKRVFAVRAGQPLPWERDHQLAGVTLKEDQTWRHVVFLGVYRLESVYDVMFRAFTPDADSYDARPPGESAFAAFVVDEIGHVNALTAVLSSCAWATGQVLRTDRDQAAWATRFEEVSREFQHTLSELVVDVVGEPGEGPRNFVRRILTEELLAACLRTAVDVVGLEQVIPTDKIRIKSVVVSRRKADEFGADFLNSFIMDDLKLVTEHTMLGDIGVALREYLRPAEEINTANRVDVRDGINAVSVGTAPDAVPSGRWPSRVTHPLAQNQQLAVNTALGMLDRSGIIGVNGPPGTGKTTMLRDLIAALVVTRAERLAALSSPADAFTGTEHRWATGNYTRVISEWRSDLTGFEVVVASANNGAVENVTNEIPAVGAIDESWRSRGEKVDYFPAIATALLASDDDAMTSSVTPQKAWGAVTARLGNKKNRGRFVTEFWYHKPDDPKADDAWFGLLKILKDYESTRPERPWSAAVVEFRAAATREAEIRARRAEANLDVNRCAVLAGETNRRREALDMATTRVERARARHAAAVAAEREKDAERARMVRAKKAELERDAKQRKDDAAWVARQRQADLEQVMTGRHAEAERLVRSRKIEADERLDARADHLRARPGLWRRLFTRGVHQGWALKDDWLAAEAETAARTLDTARAELDTCDRDMSIARQGIAAAQREFDTASRVLVDGLPTPVVMHEPLSAARHELSMARDELDRAAQEETAREQKLGEYETRLAAIESRLEDVAEHLGRHFPHPQWWVDREYRELAALWTDEEWNTARSELFLAALALHKEFLRHTASRMRRNLQAAMDVVGGGVPNEVPEPAVLAAWQSLFFVVPVVSTTFASYARVFQHLGKEALGWLLIDEAGQATPQNAVGALWRTKRAVVVGDPLQLEPVVTLPFRAEQAIRNEVGVDEQWLTCRTSVQRLADRLTPLGTTLPDQDGRTWVGIPLTVHRRCDQPMFDIANRVAYEDFMINGTVIAAGEKFAATYPSLPESSWINVAGGAGQTHWMPSEGVELDRMLEQLATAGVDMSTVMAIGPFRDIADNLRRRRDRYRGLVAGTIHVAQGKQADVVFLVLGGSQAKRGALDWAASKPNLINVAVSRAKHRLYVIGNHTSWAHLTYFSTLAANLPLVAPAAHN